MGVFEERARLKDRIRTILREEESGSISGIQKRLAKHGENLHRLIVTGYLRAMHDFGVLEERDLPPSKVYSLKAGAQQQDVYDTAGRLVAARNLPRGPEAQTLVVVLHRLFHRPIFKQEVLRANIEPLGLADWEVETKDRQSARHLLVQAGFELPHNNPAYAPPDDAVQEHGALRDEIIAELVVKGYGAHPYVQRNKQITLEEM